jgi:hypothetical protein
MIIGRPIMIDGTAVPVVGVLSASFVFPNHQTEIWLPVAVDAAETPSSGGYLRLVGRLREGQTTQSALRELRGLIDRLRQDHPDRFAPSFGELASVYPLRDDLVGTAKRTLLVLFGAVGFVLLIACANVASLFFARATVRAREMSIRTALGAGRIRLLRQALTEQLALAGCGAVLGLALAYWGSGFLAGKDAAQPPRPRGRSEAGRAARDVVSWNPWSWPSSRSRSCSWSAPRSCCRASGA